MYKLFTGKSGCTHKVCNKKNGYKHVMTKKKKRKERRRSAHTYTRKEKKKKKKKRSKRLNA